MKVAAALTALFIAGLLTSIAVAKPPEKPPKGPKPHETETTSTTTATTSTEPKCHKVELKGEGSAGSVTFKVTKANKSGRDLVGTSLDLAVPAGARVKAKVCVVAGSAPTLILLHVKAARSTS